jgi:hypothetical protein
VENLQMSREYTAEAQAVHQVIVEYNTSIDQKFTDEISDVTLKLFENLVDAERMKLNFNVDFRLVAKDHNINYEKLVQCLAYLKVIKYNYNLCLILTTLCSNKILHTR